MEENNRHKEDLAKANHTKTVLLHCIRDLKNQIQELINRLYQICLEHRDDKPDQGQSESCETTTLIKDLISEIESKQKQLNDREHRLQHQFHEVETIRNTGRENTADQSDNLRTLVMELLDELDRRQPPTDEDEACAKNRLEELERNNAILETQINKTLAFEKMIRDLQPSFFFSILSG